MSQQTLNISETLYHRLAAAAQLRGLSIEQLLEEWEQRASELSRRRQAGREMTALRERILAKDGAMPDSAELIRADRER